MKHLSVVIWSLLLLAACGQKGPLYLPEDAPPQSKPYSACDAPDAKCREQAPAQNTPTSSPADAPESSTSPGATSTESIAQ